MPLIFVCGFIWLTIAIPTLINTVIQYVPVVPVISGFLHLNQMWICTGIYGFLAWLLLHFRHKQVKSVGVEPKDLG